MDAEEVEVWRDLINDVDLLESGRGVSRALSEDPSCAVCGDLSKGPPSKGNELF